MSSNDDNGQRNGGDKRPPNHSRFKPGQSGNPKGRPKDSANFANVMQQAVNTPVSVKTGGETVTMTSAEAILRVLNKLANQGNRAARSAYFEILNATGRMADVSDRDRERRTLPLPMPLDRDVFDLFTAPALEGERCRLLAKYNDLDREGLAPQWDPKYIEGAPHPNRPREARRGPSYQEATPEVAFTGVQAHRKCFAGEFAGALSAADEAIAAGGDCELTWIRLIRAHACMMLGRSNEARDFYLQLPNDSGFGTYWPNIIFQDFANLRTSGHAHLLMDEIERKFGDLGWSAGGSPKTPKPKSQLSPEDREFMVMHPEHVHTGQLLVREGELDRAATVFRRCIKTSRSRLAANKKRPCGTRNVRARR